MKLIKLSQDHYIIVDDSKIKEGDTWYNASTGSWWKVTADNVAMYNQPSNMDRNGLNKIIYSTKPLEDRDNSRITIKPVKSAKVFNNIKEISLQEVKELIGEVDKLVYHNMTLEHMERLGYKDYAKGYKQALEDNKDKKYTEEDLMNFYKYVKTHTVAEALKHIQPKTEWELEWEVCETYKLDECNSRFPCCGESKKLKLK